MFVVSSSAGGDVDSSSKTLLGVAKPLDELRMEEWYYLIAVSIKS